MSVFTFSHGASPGTTRSLFGKMHVIRERVAQSATPALKEIGKFILTMAIFAAIMAGLAVIDILIWLPRFH